MSTSLITILSSEHGRLRREQRDIDKRDLQKALKYGELSRQWAGRWKVEYDGIIFIVDSSLRREITCFPSPLATAPVSEEQENEHQKTRDLSLIKQDIFKSHTVIVVDNSGSMRTHDINLHRDRHSAVYTLTALEFVAEQLFSNTANNSDLVSLVEFDKRANVVFAREPISWVLYNKLLSRRDERRFVDRERSKAIDMLLGDSNYLPALETAEELLARGDHEGLALSLLFLSDGAPTDSQEVGLTSTAAQAKMCNRVRGVSSRFKGRLNVRMIGFGNAYSDFSVLEAMAQAGEEELGQGHASFEYCEKAANAIGTAITSLVSSTTMTRTELMNGSHLGKTVRDISSESDTRQYSDWKFFKILDHFVYEPKAKQEIPYKGIPPGALKGYTKKDVMELWKNPPPFFAMNSHHCGKGAERLAFRCRLANDMTEKGFVLQEMVAKETNLVERIEENIEFHRLFLEGQDLASHLAEEFNRRLCALPNYDPAKTPKLFFLPCSVLLLQDHSWKGGKRGMLVEKKLDTDRFRWCKWNDNAGGVDGKAAHIAIDVDYEFKTLHKDNLCEIIEGDSDEEESDSEDSESSDEEEMIKGDHLLEKASDYLQAFTHFTYLYTNKKVMVCDLQGVYNDENVPPVFELTDPVVHYASKRGRRMVFGRTDKGTKGMQLFFNTHVCTRICKLMNLSKKNPQWKEQWRRDQAKS